MRVAKDVTVSQNIENVGKITCAAKRERHMWMNKWPYGLIVAALAMGAGSAQAAPVAGQGTWEQTLQGRDLDGNADNGFEAYYDTTQNLTWLADANWAATSGASESGLLIGRTIYGQFPGSPLEAVSLAGNADLYGIDDWQLPGLSLSGEIYDVVCQPGHVYCDQIPTSRFNVLAGTSQLQHLMEVTLGNRSNSDGSYTLENTGPFKNLQAGAYWSSEFRLTTYQYANSGWTFNTATGQHLQQPAFGSTGYSWLVRKGDVAAIPEPQSVLMWSLGILGVMGVASRRRAAVRT